MSGVRAMARGGVVLAVLGGFAPAAWAQCEGDWDVARIDTVLNEVDTMMANADLSAAKKQLKVIGAGFPCIDELAPKPSLARFGRAMGLLSFYEQDEPGAIRWGLMARITDPEGPWPGDLPEDHPYLEMLGEHENPPVGRAEGWLVVPDRGAVFINGEFIPEPTAHAEIPALVQVFDGNGHPRENYWQDGAAFRETLLSTEGEPTPVPKWYDPETGKVSASRNAAKVKVEKVKTESLRKVAWAPILSTTALALASAGTYVGATITSSGMQNATTEEQLTSARSTTNVLVAVSAGSLAGATGIALGTILSDGGGSVVWTVRF